MQKFKSHKVVEAAKIVRVVRELHQDGYSLVLEGTLAEYVTDDWAQKNSDGGTRQIAGGYFVRYPDGYTSWSPAEAFEEGYDPVDDDAAQALPLAADAQLQAPAISPVRVEALRLALGLGLSDHERVVTAARAFEAYFEGSAEDLPQIAAQ